jgi:hypothetical protein
MDRAQMAEAFPFDTHRNTYYGIEIGYTETSSEDRLSYWASKKFSVLPGLHGNALTLSASLDQYGGNAWIM